MSCEEFRNLSKRVVVLHAGHTRQESIAAECRGIASRVAVTAYTVAECEGKGVTIGTMRALSTLTEDPLCDPPSRAQHNGPAYWIKVSAQTDGSFTVTNARNGFSKTYKAGS